MPWGQWPKKDAESGETWTGSCKRAMSRPTSECAGDVTTTVAASHEVRCSSECCKRPARGHIGLPTPAFPSSFLTEIAVPTGRRPPPAHARGFILSELRSSPECCSPGPASPPALRPYSEAPPVGFRSLIAASTSSVLRWGPVPTAFHPRRFSRPRWFAPPLALWVCFAPQPRPGFALQGFVPRTQPDHLVGGPCPLVVGARALLTVARQRHASSPRPQGFAPVADPLLVQR
jgi:hypothetical protein